VYPLGYVVAISSIHKLTAYKHREIEINAYHSKAIYRTDYKVWPKLRYNKKHRSLAANKQTIYFVIFHHEKNTHTHTHKLLYLPGLYTRHSNLCYYTALRDERRLSVFENRVLRRIFGHEMGEVTGEWRKLHNE
jgi:hypothetical protein